MMKAQGAQSLRCREGLLKIIQRNEKEFVNFAKNRDETFFKLHILLDEKYIL